MTYFGFLARFLLVPIVILLLLHWRDKRLGIALPPRLQTWPPTAVIFGLVIVAVIYTTPWDNYLVATNVWWYDPALVTGYTIGWVPIEEYTFFVLQTIASGLWVWWIAKRLNYPEIFRPNPAIRWGVSGVTAVFWLISTIVLLSGYEPATYLTLILSWALIPFLVQFIFGADILWHYRNLLFWAIVPTTLYLAVADAIAINAGTWIISPTQTFHILIGGILPIEEFTFFLVTNMLVGLGMTLVLARESHERMNEFPFFRRWVPVVE
jgi:lycopene beta-cyclase